MNNPPNIAAGHSENTYFKPHRSNFNSGSRIRFQPVDFRVSVFSMCFFRCGGLLWASAMRK